MEKAGTKLGSHILCVDSYIGIKAILKKSQQIGSELKAVVGVANAGEFNNDMMEGTCTDLKTGVNSVSAKKNVLLLQGINRKFVSSRG